MNYPWIKGILNCSNKGPGLLQRGDCSNKGPGLLQRGDNYKNAKMGWGHLKIFFSRTTQLE
jgi:hypothetical protein